MKINTSNVIDNGKGVVIENEASNVSPSLSDSKLLMNNNSKRGSVGKEIRIVSPCLVDIKLSINNKFKRGIVSPSLNMLFQLHNFNTNKKQALKI